MEENHAVDVLREENKQADIRRAARGGGANVRGEEEEDEGAQVAAAVRKDDILAATREKYERAISNVPPIMEKKYWRRYVYLWIKYALFEELVAENYVRTRAVYQEMLNVIPHEAFTFGKCWMMYAKFEIRQVSLSLSLCLSLLCLFPFVLLGVAFFSLVFFAVFQYGRADFFLFFFFFFFRINCLRQENF